MHRLGSLSQAHVPAAGAVVLMLSRGFASSLEPGILLMSELIRFLGKFASFFQTDGCYKAKKKKNNNSVAVTHVIFNEHVIGH